MYVVSGVTGKTGRATAQTLLDDHQSVTVLVRSIEQGAEWRAKGAQVATSSLDDGDELGAILDGKDGVYLLIPPDLKATHYLRDRQRFIDAYAKAAYVSRVRHVVLLSSIGAQHPSGTGPIVTAHNAEMELRGAAQNLTILRPASFMENWASVLGMAKESGTLPSFLTPDRTISTIATRDIGWFAADSLLNPAHGLRIRELAGPRDYRPEEIAAALGNLLGREVKLQPVLARDVVGALGSAGISDPMAHLLAEMYQGFNNGFITFEGQSADFSRGRTTIEEVFAGLLRSHTGDVHH